MRVLSRLVWHLAIASVFAIACGYFFLFVDQQICGEVHGQNAAGAGAAIGMLAVAVAAISWVLSFLVLSFVDLGRYLKLWNMRPSVRLEIVGLFGALVVWVVAAMTILRVNGC